MFLEAVVKILDWGDFLTIMEISAAILFITGHYQEFGVGFWFTILFFWVWEFVRFLEGRWISPELAGAL